LVAAQQKHWFKLDEQQFKYVQTVPHWACLRSNGNPYFVYFTKYEDVNQIMYIDKKVQPGYQKPRIILTKGQFDDEIFNNTLLEGEMVKDQNQQWVFLINDIIIYKGRYLNGLQLPVRLGYAYELLEKHYQADDWMDVCQFQVKRYFECSQDAIAEMLMFSKDMPYTNRGIYFMPHNMKYKPKLMNFNDELIKNVYRKVKTILSSKNDLNKLLHQNQVYLVRLIHNVQNKMLPMKKMRKCFGFVRRNNPIFTTFTNKKTPYKKWVLPQFHLSISVKCFVKSLRILMSQPLFLSSVNMKKNSKNGFL